MCTNRQQCASRRSHIIRWLLPLKHLETSTLWTVAAIIDCPFIPLPPLKHCCKPWGKPLWLTVSVQHMFCSGNCLEAFVSSKYLKSHKGVMCCLPLSAGYGRAPPCCNLCKGSSGYKLATVHHHHPNHCSRPRILHAWSEALHTDWMASPFCRIWAWPASTWLCKPL